jgi:hypothetical protein
MLKLLIALLGVAAFWSFMVGWSVMYAFADTSSAANVSRILMYPVILIPMPGLNILYVIGFWCLLSILALLRDASVCRYLARGLLLAHWVSTAVMFGWDLFSGGSAVNIAKAFGAYPSLTVFLLVYGFTQYHLCKRLVREDQDVDETIAASAASYLTGRRPWKW